MKKRPLCMICMIVVLLMWMIQASKGENPVEACELKNVTIYGKIYQCEYKEKKQILYLKQTVLSDKSQKQKLNNIRITCAVSEDDFYVSDIISIKGDLKTIKGATNWGQFDVQDYYSAKKVGYMMWEPEITLLKRPAYSLHRGLEKIRREMAKKYDSLLPNQYGALLKGISLGEKNDISAEITDLFQLGGISHVLAISALHLQILGSSLYKLLRKCGISLGMAAVVAAVFLSCYGILTGASVATIRALLMFLVNIGADVTGRTYDGSTAMALSAVILTAGNPEYLSYSGFWLSFTAVASFMIFHERRQFFSGVILYFFMAPVMLIYFFEMSPYSVFVNLLVVPTVGGVLIFGLLGCIGGFFHILFGRILLFPAVVILHIYKFLCELCGYMPGHTWNLGKPGWLPVIIYYGIMAAALFFFRKNRLKKRRVLALLFMVPAWLILTIRPIDGIQITMLDIGQGDAMVIRSEQGTTYLIDGGSTSEEDIAQYKMVPYLKYEGISRIRAAFLTHADEDHVNGIMELLDMISKGETQIVLDSIILPDWKDMSPFETVFEKAKENDIEIYRFKSGGVMEDGNMRFTCLGPDGENYSNRTNEGSMVLRLDYNNFSMLFTGDLEGDAETKLLGTYGNVDVLKVAHHGSKNSTSADFLQEVQPEISLISVGEKNTYGHPHQELLERLRKSGSKIFDTSKWGALMIRTDGEKIDLKTYKQYNEP